MPLAKELASNETAAIVGLIRWVIICTISVCVTVFGWAWNMNAGITSNNALIRAVQTQTLEYQRGTSERITRLENRLDNN